MSTATASLISSTAASSPSAPRTTAARSSSPRSRTPASPGARARSAPSSPTSTTTASPTSCSRRRAASGCSRGTARATSPTSPRRAGDLAISPAGRPARPGAIVDNDGRLDLVVGCLRGPNRVLPQQGRRHLRGRTEKIGLSQRIFNSQAVGLVDLNNDGQLDMVFNNEGQDSVVLLGDRASAHRQEGAADADAEDRRRHRRQPGRGARQAGQAARHAANLRRRRPRRPANAAGALHARAGDVPRRRYGSAPGRLRTQRVTVGADPMRAVVGEPPATARAK